MQETRIAPPEIGDEAEFAEIARYISDYKIALRYGETGAGAAYALADIAPGGKDVPKNFSMMSYLLWTTRPKQAAFHPRWAERFSNTCMKIAELSKSGKVKLWSGTDRLGSERYLLTEASLRCGDGYTFGKINRLPNDAKEEWSHAYTDQGTLEATGKALCGMVLGKLAELAKPPG
ncbi:hypothetical protein [Nocardiopsis potens]|uniref:hypothetical protein n=1 Tax=Nocardiopsis potens TaxID=1246458 RepID=UPI00034A2206|nr:hypothetical protein [Nocardiopsis potens]